MGWTFTHDQGRIALDEHFGDAVETVVAESVAEGADAERVMTQMILGGADMIVATSFGFGPGGERGRGPLPRMSISNTPRATCASIRTSPPTTRASTRAGP